MRVQGCCAHAAIATALAAPAPRTPVPGSGWPSAAAGMYLLMTVPTQLLRISVRSTPPPASVPPLIFHRPFQQRRKAAA